MSSFSSICCTSITNGGKTVETCIWSKDIQSNNIP